jgi:hypothetical protein
MTNINNKMVEAINMLDKLVEYMIEFEDYDAVKIMKDLSKKYYNYILVNTFPSKDTKEVC